MHVAAARTHGAVHPFTYAFVSYWILFHIQYYRYCIQQSDLRQDFTVMNSTTTWARILWGILIWGHDQDLYHKYIHWSPSAWRWRSPHLTMWLLQHSLQLPRQQIRLCLQSVHSAHVCSATLCTLPFFCSLDGAWWNICISYSVQMLRRLDLNHGARVTAMKSNMKAS